MTPLETRLDTCLKSCLQPPPNAARPLASKPPKQHIPSCKLSRSNPLFSWQSLNQNGDHCLLSGRFITSASLQRIRYALLRDANEQRKSSCPGIPDNCHHRDNRQLPKAVLVVLLRHDLRASMAITRTVVFRHLSPDARALSRRNAK